MAVVLAINIYVVNNMRILKFILKSFLILAIVLVIVGLISREVMLIIGMQRIASNLKEMRDIASSQRYASECMGKGSNASRRGYVHQTQLRFVDDNEFVVEAVCNQFELDPIQISEAKVPRLVKHEKGQSGLVWNPEGTAGINLSCLGRTVSVQVKDAIVSQSFSSYPVETGSGPKSQCDSFGYTCCDTKHQKGAGVQLTDVVDCPKSCHETCLDRPLILSFNTQPYYDTLTRKLKIKSNQSVVFSYSVSPNQEDSFAGVFQEESDWIERHIYLMSMLLSLHKDQEEEKVEVTIDFGDGTQETFKTLQAQKEHQYTCSRGECEYLAKLKIVNSSGIESASDEQSQIKINVSR